MGDIWYNEIAKRNGGYKSFAKYKRVGKSGEDAFKTELLQCLKNTDIILDAGCGHGEFSIEIAKYVKKLFGIDNAEEMIKIANRLKAENNANNIDFIFASTKGSLPFKDEFFDLIYSRRGPTSIIDHDNLLKKNGIIIGIHSGAFDRVKARLTNNNYKDIKITEYNDSFLIFDNEIEYTKYLSDFPGNPNYFLEENKNELMELIKQNTIDGKIKVKEWRYIWKAKKQ